MGVIHLQESMKPLDLLAFQEHFAAGIAQKVGLTCEGQQIFRLQKVLWRGLSFYLLSLWTI